MMVSRTIKISPDGREIKFLYDDKIPWQDLGKMQCVRASDVVFETGRQKWFVQLKPPVRGVWRIGPFTSRTEAIGEEIKFLEGTMEEEDMQALAKEG